MSGPGGGRDPRDFSTSARLALLGLGTLATGAIGLVSLAAGYKVKKSTAQDPDKVTPKTYFDDLVHLVPPWQHVNSSTDASSSSSSSDSSGALPVLSPIGGMDIHGFTASPGSSHRDLENESKHSHELDDPFTLDPEERSREEREMVERIGREEERALQAPIDPAAVEAAQTSTPGFPLSPMLLVRICSFLSFTDLCRLSRVSRGWNVVGNTMTSSQSVAYRSALAGEGWSDHERGRIWMRLSGADKLALTMSAKCMSSPHPTSDDGSHDSSSCDEHDQVNFYQHLLELSKHYRQAIIKQNKMGGIRNPRIGAENGTDASSASSSSVTSDSSSSSSIPAPSLSPSPPSSSPDWSIDGLAPSSHAALDSILKDVPRTICPSNASSSSIIMNRMARIREWGTSRMQQALIGEDEKGTQHEPTGTSSTSSSSTNKSVGVDMNVVNEAISSDAPASPSLLSPESARRHRALEESLQSSVSSLANVLSVYALHDTEVSYTQGMNYVASFVLSKLPEEDAYWLFFQLMQDCRWNLRAFYAADLKGLLVCKYQFSKLFKIYLPKLHQHFVKEEIHSDIMTEWFMTFFCYASFPRRFPLLERIWDLLLILRGTCVFHRLALSILYLSQSSLLTYSFEEIVPYLKTLPDDGILDPQIILPLICHQFKVSNAYLALLEEEYEREEEPKRIKRKMEIERSLRT